MTVNPERKSGQSGRIPARWKSLLRDLLLFAALFGGLQWWRARDMAPVGQTVATLQGTSLSGEDISLARAGTTTIVYVFSTWCTVCRFSTPNMVDLQAEADTDLRVVGVALSWQTQQELADYRDTHAINFPIIPGDYSWQDTIGVSVFPSILVLNEKGEVRWRTTGYTTATGLKLRALLDG